MTGLGVAAGVAVAFPATRALGPFLFRTSPGDPTTFLAAATLLAVLALAASYVPARHAARVDPLIALRTD